MYPKNIVINKAGILSVFKKVRQYQKFILQQGRLKAILKYLSDGLISYFANIETNSITTNICIKEYPSAQLFHSVFRQMLLSTYL